jgi:hypothetical protein
VSEEKAEALSRLERLYKNLDTKMTRDRYLSMCEQMGKEPDENEIPPDWEDFPEIVQYAINIFNMLGDRVYPDIGYVGKDYSNLQHYIDVYKIEDVEFLLDILHLLDSRAIKQSSDDLKKAYDKLKRKK